MNKYILVSGFLVALAGIFFGFMYFRYNSPPQEVIKSVIPTPTPVSQSYVKIGDKQISVVIADSDEERRVGLSKTKSLTDDEGMLFLFNEENIKPPFWMKNMSMAIDIIWINDGMVAEINENVPAQPGAKDSELRLYVPDEPIDQVLEVRAGWASEHGITKGDAVLNFFSF